MDTLARGTIVPVFPVDEAPANRVFARGTIVKVQVVGPDGKPVSRQGIEQSFGTDTEKRASTNVNPGDYIVVTGEANRREQFVPIAPCYVVTGGTLPGVYTGRGIDAQMDGQREYFNLAGKPDDAPSANSLYGLGWTTAVGWTVGFWAICDSTGAQVYYQFSNAPLPPTSGWLHEADNSPAPEITVTRQDTADPRNWIALDVTFQLIVDNQANNDAAAGSRLDDCPAGTSTNVGWVNANTIPFQVGSTDDFIAQVFDGDNNDVNTGSVLLNRQFGSTDPQVIVCPIPATNRGIMTFILYSN